MGLILYIVCGVAALWLLTCFNYVPGKTSYVQEGLKGPKEKALGRGFHITLPWPITRTVGKANHKWRTDTGSVKVRSQDDAIFGLPYELQFRAIENPLSAVKAVYELTDPKRQMMAFVDNELPQFIRNKLLDDVYGDRSIVQGELQSKLKDEFDDYGYEVKLLIQDPILDENQEAGYNRKRTAQLLKDAASDEAEAAKIKEVGQARAESESKELQGQGVAKMRQAVANGMKESMQAIKDAAPELTDNQVMDFLLEINRLDTLTTVGSDGNLILMDLNKMSSNGSNLGDNVAAFAAYSQNQAKQTEKSSAVN